MTVAIAILMKDPGAAKTRLSPVLANDAREKLALLLFENTLQFFMRTHAGEPIGIVTAATLRLYPGGFHETLNDLDRQTVIDELTQWLLRHLPDAPSTAAAPSVPRQAALGAHGNG